MKKVLLDKQWLENELKTKLPKVIAKELGVAASTIRSKIRNFNINYKLKGGQVCWPSKEILEKELRESSTFELAKKYNVHVATFRNYIRKLGIERSKHGHLINEHFFQTWSHDMAYVLGFTFADGSVVINEKYSHNTVTYDLNKKDYEVLEYVKNLIYPTCEIYEVAKFNKKRNKTYKSCMLTFSSKYLIRDLINLGCIQNKTYEPIKLPNIPEEFFGDFLRGYFDGDGTVSKDRLEAGFCCHQREWLEEIRNILGYGYIKKSKKLYRLEFYSRSDITNLYETMYKNEGFYLQRKKNRFNIILNKELKN